MDIKKITTNAINKYNKIRSLQIKNDNENNVNIDSFSKTTPDSDITKIEVLHFNDLHGQVVPFEDIKLVPLPGQVAGITYLAAEILKKVSQHGRANTIILDAGDWFDGSPEGEETKGKVIFDFFNYLNIDATEVGNHDIRKTDFFDPLLKYSKVPVLGANIIDKNTKSVPDNIKPYIIENKGGQKIAIIGLLTPKAKWQLKDTNTHYEVLEPEEVLGKYIKEVKQKGVKTIFVLSHLGLQDDRKIAKEFKDIDVIIGGHSHTSMKHAEKVGNAIIVQAGNRGEFLGDLSLDIDKKTGKVVSYNYKLEPIIDSKIKEDKLLKLLLNSTIQPISEKYDSIIAKTDIDLLHSNLKPSTLDYLVVDAFRDAGNTEIAFLGSNAVAQNIYKGKITKRKIFQAFPWHESLVKGKLPGFVVKTMIEDQLKDSAYKKILPSGFKYSYDSSLPEGKRLKEVVLDNGKKLEDNKYYSVTINTYLFNYDIIKNNIKDVEQLQDARLILYDYFKQLGNIKSIDTNRIKDISSKKNQ